VSQDVLIIIVERAIKLAIFMPVMGLTAWWLFSAWLEKSLSTEETIVGGGLWASAFILGALSIVHGGWGFMGILGSVYVLLLGLATWEYISARKMEQDHLRDEVEKYRHAIDLDPRNAAAYSFLGATYLKLSRFGEAEEMLAKALELEPESRMDRRLLTQARQHQPRLPRHWAD
jgi:tetratricopeptide (TPR) repeat protein